MNTFLRDQTMRVMQGCRGQANALPRKVLLAELKLYRPTLTDRDCRELYAGLPICSCEDGLFLPQTVAEVLEFKRYLSNGPGGPIAAWKRCAIIYEAYPGLVPPAEQLRLGI